ncbi:MAG: 2-hydroxyacyl-CoA dehydratase family protein [Dehalococcoidia bacterium]|nr:2-hydroxyacyl-CoA dehydratase family protein [Dehalococcoidia bacterium]
MTNEGKLNPIEEAYRNRLVRAKEMSERGEKVVGYFYGLVPVEMLTAAGLIPYRITGDINELITRADAHLEMNMCSFVRNAFDLGIKGCYDFLDGIVTPHACDCIFRLHDIWRSCIPTTYAHFINVPHMASTSSLEFFEDELELFKRSLEEYAGVKLTDDRLNKAIGMHNRNRRLMRELYQLRKSKPPMITGSEMVKVEVAARCLPVNESNKLVQNVIRTVKDRKPGPAEHKPRFILYGAEVDQPSFVELFEKGGADVVVDATSLGTDDYWYDVNGAPSPLAALANRYLLKIPSPRTCKNSEAQDHSEDMEFRFGHLGKLAREFKANAAIVYIIRFCDTYELDAPDVREYLQKVGLPVLDIEDEYHTQSLGRLQTRVEAFVESLQS